MISIAPTRFDFWFIGNLTTLLGKHPLFDLGIQSAIDHNVLGGLWFGGTFFILWVRCAREGSERQQLRLLTTITGSIVAALITVICTTFVRWPPPNHHPALIPLYPEYLDPNPNTSSFPSQSTAVYSAIAAGISSIWRRPGVLLWAAVALIVALPRMVMGGHYPTDVFVGVIVGFVGYFVAYGLEPSIMARIQPLFERRSRSQILATLLVFVLILQISTGFREFSWVQRMITLYTSSDPLRIGGDSFFGQFFRGNIDEVRIYNRALRREEIVADMNAPIAGPLSPSMPRTCPAPNGLVAAYSFDEGHGNTITDGSGCANVGTAYQTAWTRDGRFGSALAFNGIDSWVTIKDSPSLHLVTEMTLEAWVYPITAPSHWRDVIYKEVDLYFLGASSDPKTPAAGGTFHNGLRIVRAPFQLPLNVWSHLATTFDGSKLRLYVNGIEVASRAERTPLVDASREYFLK